MHRKRKELLYLVATVLISMFLIVYLNVKYKTDYPAYLYVVFLLSLLFIYSKLIGTYLHIRKINTICENTECIESVGRVSVLIPCYNESHESIIKLFNQLENQTHLPYEVIFIDDFSTDTENYTYVKSLISTSIFTINPIRFSQNQGKLNAVEWGIKHAQGDFIMLIDADSYIHESAIENLLKPMNFDDTISATCGQVLPSNRNTNFLTKMQSILYYNAYNVGRHYQSYFGNVLVCSGAISMYRKSEVIPYLNELTTTYKGKRRLSGDDIVLTNIILKNGGKSVYIENAECYTLVPESIEDFYHQQLRWAKDSFYIFFESFSTIISMPTYFILQFQEVLFWLVSLVSFMFFIISNHIKVGYKAVLLIALFMLIISIVDNFYVLENHHENVFKTIVYYNAYQFILIPIRIIGFMTFFHQSWKKHSEQLNV